MTSQLPGLLNTDVLGLDLSSFICLRRTMSQKARMVLSPCGKLQVKSAWLGRLQLRKNGKNKWSQVCNLQHRSDTLADQKKNLLDAVR